MVGVVDIFALGPANDGPAVPAAPKLVKRGQVVRVERFLSAGNYEPTRTITCVAVRFQLPGGERVLPFNCGGLSTYDQYLVRQGDVVLVTAEDFNGNTKHPSDLSLLWDLVIAQKSDQPVTETGVITRVAKFTVSYRDKQYDNVVVSANMTNVHGQKHPVVFATSPGSHLHIAFAAVGQQIELSYERRGSSTGAEVMVKSLKVDLTFTG